MTETKEIIKYKPYRGVLEKVQEVRRAQVTLHDSFLELVYDYDMLGDLGKSELRRSALLIAKRDISVSLTTWYHEEDMTETSYPRVEIYICGGYVDFVYVETIEEAYDIYKQIKNWLLR